MEIIELGDGLVNYQTNLEKYFKTNVDVVLYNYFIFKSYKY